MASRLPARHNSPAFARACMERIARILDQGPTPADRAAAERVLAAVECRLPLPFPAPRGEGVVTAAVARSAGETQARGAGDAGMGPPWGVAHAGSEAAILGYTAGSRNY